MKISIFASIWCQNLWDELLLKNEIQILEEKFWKETQFRVFTYDVENPFTVGKNIEYKEYFPVGIKNIRNIPRNIKNFFSFLGSVFWSDLVVIWGGGIFYESEFQSTKSPLDLWNFRLKWIDFFRKKILFFAVGIDVYSEKWVKKLEKIFSWKRKEITLRDRESFYTLQKLKISSEIVKDPVFFENNKKWTILNAINSREFSLKDIEKYNFWNKKVWIALRKGYIWTSRNDKIEELLVNEVLNFIEKKWGKIILLPHSFHKVDIKANDKVFLEKFMTEKREIKNSLEDVYEIYKKREIDICIGMRLHSIILSYVYGIDCIALSYSIKTDETIKKLLR